MVALNSYWLDFVEYKALFYWWLQIALGVGVAALVSTFVVPITAGGRMLTTLCTCGALVSCAQPVPAGARPGPCAPPKHTLPPNPCSWHAPPPPAPAPSLAVFLCPAGSKVRRKTQDVLRQLGSLTTAILEEMLAPRLGPDGLLLGVKGTLEGPNLTDSGGAREEGGGGREERGRFGGGLAAGWHMVQAHCCWA